MLLGKDACKQTPPICYHLHPGMNEWNDSWGMLKTEVVSSGKPHCCSRRWVGCESVLFLRGVGTLWKHAFNHWDLIINLLSNMIPESLSSRIQTPIPVSVACILCFRYVFLTWDRALVCLRNEIWVQKLDISRSGNLKRGMKEQAATGTVPIPFSVSTLTLGWSSTPHHRSSSWGF